MRITDNDSLDCSAQNELVLTDFEAWQIAMNGWYLTYDDDDSVDDFLDELEEKPLEEQERIIKESWNNVFI